MEQDFNQPNSSLGREALKWSCEVLDLEAENQAVKKKETRREAITSFFESLKSNDFFTDGNSLEAVEIIHGKPADRVPAFVRWHEKNQFQQLDDIVEWFAIQLGEQDHRQLVAALKSRLSSFDSETTSVNVRGYGQKIWAAAQAVQSPMNESDLAVKKILQALFHISTTRPTKRQRVRSQLVGKLKNEFSEDQLATARRIVQNYKTPNEVFHRPFLSLLTSDEESVESFQINQPISLGSQSFGYSRNFESKSTVQTRKESANNWWLAMVVVASLFGVIMKVGVAVNKSNNKALRTSQPAKMPMIQFDPKLDPDDPRSVEATLKVLKALGGKDSNLPTLNEFTELKKKAEAAQRRIDARKEAQAASPKSAQSGPVETEEKVERQSTSDWLDKISGQSPTKPTIPRSPSLTDPWGTLDKTSSQQMERIRGRAATPFETIDKVLESQRKYNEQLIKSEREAMNKRMRKQQEIHKKILEDSKKLQEETRQRFERIRRSRIAPGRGSINPLDRQIPFGGY